MMICNELHDALNSVTIQFTNLPLFLLYDFNYPTIYWSDHTTFKHNSSECVTFLRLCNDFNLTQLVLQPTRITAAVSNVLDLVLTTTPDVVGPLTSLA